MKIKTKHIITCIKCLFLGLVMALPFIAVLPTALYYGFNKYAVSGDKVEYEYKSNVVNKIEDLKEGNVYRIVYNEQRLNSSLYLIITDLIGIEELPTLPYLNIELSNDTYLIPSSIYTEEEPTNLLILSQHDYTIKIHDITYTLNNMMDNQTYVIQDIEIVNDTEYQMEYIIDFQYKGNWIDVFNYTDEDFLTEIIENGNLTFSNYKGKLIKSETITNQNALEIAFNNVFTTKGFNWVSNSIIATPIYAFVGAFGLTSDLFLSNLIVYWTNILLIYAILNFVLVVFTKLTQLGKKKEED